MERFRNNPSYFAERTFEPNYNSLTDICRNALEAREKERDKYKKILAFQHNDRLGLRKIEMLPNDVAAKLGNPSIFASPLHISYTIFNGRTIGLDKFG